MLTGRGIVDNREFSSTRRVASRPVITASRHWQHEEADVAPPESGRGPLGGRKKIPDSPFKLFGRRSEAGVVVAEQLLIVRVRLRDRTSALMDWPDWLERAVLVQRVPLSPCLSLLARLGEPAHDSTQPADHCRNNPSAQGGRGRTGVPAPESGEHTLSQGPAPNHAAGINTVKRVQSAPAGPCRVHPHRLPHYRRHGQGVGSFIRARSRPIATLRRCLSAQVLCSRAAASEPHGLSFCLSLRQPTCMGGRSSSPSAASFHHNGCRAGGLACWHRVTAERSRPVPSHFIPPSHESWSTQQRTSSSCPRSLQPPGLGLGEQSQTTD